MPGGVRGGEELSAEDQSRDACRYTTIAIWISMVGHDAGAFLSFSLGTYKSAVANSPTSWSFFRGDIWSLDRTGSGIMKIYRSKITEQDPWITPQIIKLLLCDVAR